MKESSVKPDEEFDDGPIVEVVFRQIFTQCPYVWLTGLHWYAELHVGDIGAPVGIAFVTAMPGERPFVEYMFIQDQYRRRGWGSYLLDAVMEKWPFSVLISDSKKGDLLIDSWERRHGKTQDEIRKEWKEKRATDLANGNVIDGEKILDDWVRRYQKSECENEGS